MIFMVAKFVSFTLVGVKANFRYFASTERVKIGFKNILPLHSKVFKTVLIRIANQLIS